MNEVPVYQIQGYLDQDDRPNIEILFEDNDKELVLEVYKTWKKYYAIKNDGEVSVKEVRECYEFLDENGVSIDLEEEYTFTGVYESTKLD